MGAPKDPALLQSYLEVDVAAYARKVWTRDIPQLADCITDCRYLRQIGDTKLIVNSRPCSKYSDHLPLLVTMEMGKCHGR